MKNTMKVVVPAGKGKVAVVEKPIPQLREDQVLIKVEKCGICGSDLHTMRGEIPCEVIGHEIVGTIADPGKFSNQFKVGDRVSACPPVGCGECWYCKHGRDNDCPNIPWDDYDGFMSEYLAFYGRGVVKIADSISDDVAALIEPFSVGYHGAKLAEIEKSDRVLVLGGGIIGASVLESVRYMGADVTAITEVSEDRLAVHRQLGRATAVVDSKQPDYLDTLKKVSGGSFDKIIDCTGIVEVINQVMPLLKPCGILVAVGVGPAKTPFDFWSFIMNEQVIKGSNAQTYKEFCEVEELFASGAIDVTPYAGLTFAMDDVQQAFDTALAGKGGLKIFVETK